MSTAKSIFGGITASGLERELGDRQMALEYIAEAWNSAEDDGIDSQSLAHASLFAALATFVRIMGEEVTAEMLGDLPDRIRSGEYNVERRLQ